MCSPDLSHIAYCDLADTSKSTGVSSFSIPDKFRYFPDEVSCPTLSSNEILFIFLCVFFFNALTLNFHQKNII